MNRRQAIGLGIGAAIAIPAGLVWWNKSRLEGETNLSEDSQKILSAAVDAILPATQTPGAKKLGVDLFVAKMVADCYDDSAQKTFHDGLTELNKQSNTQFEDDFAGIDNEQRVTVLKSFPKDDAFIKLIRELTILGYKKSEYFMENIEMYEFIPGRYLGCVNID